MNKLTSHSGMLL